MAAQEQAPNLQQLFPPPPPYYKLFRGDADGSAERPLPPLPPPPIEGEYQMFGELHTTEDGLPPLDAEQLYQVDSSGRIDIKGELLRLHRELLACFLELLSVLADAPSKYTAAVQQLGLVLRNMQHVLSAARPYQARATLAHMLKQEVAERQRAVQELRAAREAAGAALQGGAERLGEAMAQMQAALQRAAGAAGGREGEEASAGGMDVS